MPDPDFSQPVCDDLQYAIRDQIQRRHPALCQILDTIPDVGNRGKVMAEVLFYLEFWQKVRGLVVRPGVQG